jgi:hypothetical protein
LDIKFSSENLKKVFLPKKQVFNNLSKVVSNPFDIIAKNFENVPLVTIERRTINIKIPWLTEEEFERQKAYLK